MNPTKTFLTLWVCLGLIHHNLEAQYHELKLDAGGAVVGNWGIGYEYCINDDMGVNLRIGYFNPDEWLELDDNYTAFTVTADYRYYLDFDEGADDFFVGAYLKFRDLSSENYYYLYDPNTGESQTADYSSIDLGFGVSVGWKTVTFRGFLVETYAGVGRYFIQNEEVPAGFEDYEDFDIPFDVRVGLVLGWRLGQ